MHTEVTNQIPESPPLQPALPIAWPKDAKDVRDFFHADFISAKFAAADQTPCNEDQYLISAHDFLSAVNWWANFPHAPRVDQAAPLPLLIRDIARDLGITALDACRALKDLGNFSVNMAVTAEMAAKLRELFPVPQAAPAAVAVPDERAAFEATNITGRYYRSSEPGCADKYADPHTQLAWKSWQARAALAATPANCDSLEQLSENNGLAAVVLPEPVTTITSIDECGPCLGWFEHWANYPIGTKLYTEQQMRALLAGVSAPAVQAVPAFCHVASLKLKSLQERGYQITGYALEKPVEGAQPERGFINHGGFVGWWWDGQSPQAQADARDAKRYRWCREQAEFYPMVLDGTGLLCADLAEAESGIDAAIAAQAAQGVE